MIRRVTVMMAVGLLAGSMAQAQDKKVELGVTAGWTFSDGVSGASVDINGDEFTRIDPKDSFSWGGRLGFMVTPNVEVGGLFNLQSSKLQISGPANTAELGDVKLYNYHGYVAYNLGDPDAKARPYFLVGAGATQFGSIDATLGDLHRTIEGTTKFSTTWALGLKVNAGNSAALRLEGRWTPTYIKSDASGYWCDPYWGCYLLSDAQYANQFEISGGITLRF